jgi:hypothetical protein
MQMTTTTTGAVNLNDLMEMDVVVYSETTTNDHDTTTSSSSSRSSSTTATKSLGTKRKLGAVQEDGRITPLCVWTTEYAFQQSLEFLVDEEDLFPGFKSFRSIAATSNSSEEEEEDDDLDNKNAAVTASAASTQPAAAAVAAVVVGEIWIHSIVPQDALSYGSRQVGGGMGPGNPHGEESELLYYIDQSILDRYDIEIIVKPELEIFW